MTPIFDAGWQLTKVRMVMFASLIALAVSLYFGISIIQTYGLAPADGGELASLPVRLAFGGTVILLGAAFALGMGLYGRQYAARIAFDLDRKQLHLETVGFLWGDRYVFDVAEIGDSQYHEDLDLGKSLSLIGTVTGHRTQHVNAPWTTVWMKGWYWPLLIDQQGNILHPDLMEALVGVSE